MKQEVKKLIAGGNLEKALELLVIVDPDVLLLQAQFNNGRKNFNMGLIEHSEWQRISARVTYAALEICNKMPDNVPATQPSHSTKQTDNNNSMDNPLKRANQVFKEIQDDLDNFDYNVTKLQGYCAILDKCTNSSIFHDGLKLGDLTDSNLLAPQTKERVKTVLELILSKKESVLNRLKQFVEKSNNEVEMSEALNLFKKKPNSENWKLVYNLLFDRFSDTTLFDPKVQAAWYGWDDKFKDLKTELDWGLDFKNTQDEIDLWEFIKVNSQIKNFNYN
jgi:hypothetical protein